MSWKDKDKPDVKIDRKFVSCEEKHELDYVKRRVRDAYPDLTGTEIDKAIESCCKEVPGPRPRDRYMECLKKKLDLNE
jgi:hypothetical protein